MLGNLPRAFDEAEVDESLLLRLRQHEGSTDIEGHVLTEV